MADRQFRDRREAGRVLAGMLGHHRGRDDLLVLALPRGGVPVGYELATALGAPLDVFIVRKLGVPGHEELAMGAIASGGVVVLNDDVVRGLDIPPDDIQRVADAEGRELARREREYRGEGAPPDVAGRTVILVDDGLATGSSMRAALQALPKQHPRRVVVAVPAAPESTCTELAVEVDEVVCATTPSPFWAVGQAYWDFTQTTDEEVRRLLATARDQPATRAARRTGAGAIRLARVPLDRGESDLETLLDVVGDARIVLLGEASHGTHEFYERRAWMTRQLIEHRGFDAVAAEADWPDAYRVNRWVHGRGRDGTAEEALRGFERFPTWMWRNAPVLDFVGWLREHNDRGPNQTGFYGLDLYSLFRSMDEVIAVLEDLDPEAAARARQRYACFDHYRDEAQDYGYSAAFGAGESCERQVVEQLVELHRRAPELAGALDDDERFYLEQNATTVKAAEEYYRTVFGGRASSWNKRDCHMIETLEALDAHLGSQLGRPARVVVWAHNSHLGDARATEAVTRGELNLGQLVRERYPGACRSIGFTTYTGTVTAADDWGGPADRKRVRRGLPGSHEELLHEVAAEDYWIVFGRSADADDTLRQARPERAIGVIYRPQTERQSHYFAARLSDQFDAVVHLEETRAVEPLERTPRWDRGELPETFSHAV